MYNGDCMLGWFYRVGDRIRQRARRGRWSAAMASGRRGEDLAHRFLQRHGYRVVARNYRPPGAGGEIDLIAWHGGALVFVEVKSRASEEYGTPDRAVDRVKQEHIARAARDYARRAGVPLEHARFDVVNVVMANPPQLEIVRDAFRPGR